MTYSESRKALHSAIAVHRAMADPPSGSIHLNIDAAEHILNMLDLIDAFAVLCRQCNEDSGRERCLSLEKYEDCAGKEEEKDSE